MSSRKEAKLQIRFESFILMDKIEIWANRRGEKLVPWSRKALLRQAQVESSHEIILEAAMFSALESVSLLRELAGPEASKRACDYAEDFIKKVEADVAANFE